jgi:hypothetical protein
MTDEEAEPFKPELHRLLKTHKYHFEYAPFLRNNPAIFY